MSCSKKVEAMRWGQYPEIKGERPSSGIGGLSGACFGAEAGLQKQSHDRVDYLF